MRAYVIPVMTLAAIVCSADSPAALSADGSFFVRGNVGQSSINAGPFDSSTGYAVDGGYRWVVGTGNLIGIEAGYTDLGSIYAESAVPGLHFDIHGPTLGANARFDVAQNWHVDAQAGWMHADYTGHVDFSNVPPGGGTLGVWYAGVGLGYDVTNHFSIGAAYDYYRAKEYGVSRSPDLISVGGEYRF
jgi:OOP family OmpA-OmpF porin